MEQKTISTLQMHIELLNEKQGEWIPYARSIGRIAKGMIVPYPPGIPLIVPGEKITVPILTELEDGLKKVLISRGTSIRRKVNICSGGVTVQKKGIL